MKSMSFFMFFIFFYTNMFHGFKQHEDGFEVLKNGDMK